MAVDIILDAGHGGFDQGATYMGRSEKDDSLWLTLAVGEKLKNKGYEVYYTRTTDVYQTPYEKAALANQSQGKVFVSIHRNSGIEDNLYEGTQVLVNEKNNQVGMIGNAINEGLAEIGFPNLGIEEIPELIVLRETDMPAVLLEVGFINSDNDNRRFDENRDAIVEAIVQGIQDTIPLSAQELTEVYYVQTGLFKYDVNAAYQLERLELQGYMGQIHYEKPYYGVWVGQSRTIDQAVDLQNDLKKLGYTTLIVSMQEDMKETQN